MTHARARRLFATLAVGLSAPPSFAEPALAPDARGAEAPDRSFDLLSLDLQVELDPAVHGLTGTATYTVRRLASGPLVLDQVALDIRSVEVGGSAADWFLRADSLVVAVPGDRGDDSVVTIDYAATPRTGLHFRDGGRGLPDRYSEVWSQGEGIDNRHWIPLWDHPNDRFDYSGAVTLAGGEARWPGWRTLTNSGVDLVGYLVMLAAGPYQVVGEPTAEVWFGPGIDRADAERASRPIASMAEWFGWRTGVPYPWGPYRQVFVQRFLYGGMENTSATVEDEKFLVDASRATTAGRWGQSVYAHELAHQWYGDLLTCRTWRELWLNEGFATFMAADWTASQAGVDTGAAPRTFAADEARPATETTEAWASSVRGWYAGSQGGTALAGRFFAGPDAPANHNVYAKGASVLQMLRAMLGESVFWQAMAAYTADHRHQLVETRDLQRAMEDASGQHLGWFFQQWTELNTVPRLSVSSAHGEGKLTVTVRQDIDDEHPRYTLPVEFEIGLPALEQGGEARTELLHGWLDDDRLDLQLDTADPPLWVAFDPRGGVLAKVDQEQDPVAWTAQLQSASPFARLAAVEALGKTDQAGALVDLLGEADASVVLRTAAAAALGEQRATAALLPSAADPNDQVRQAVVEALGKGADDSAARTLRGIARKDGNRDVRATALSALANVDPRAGAVEARAALRSGGPSYDDPAVTARRVLGEHGEPADLLRLLDTKAPGRLRVDGMLAAARLVARQDPGTARDRMAERVARFGEGLLDDLDVRTRQNAIGVLAEVGDDRSVAALERYRRVETEADLAAAAGRSIERIRARKAEPAATPNQVEAKIQALEDRIDALQKSLDAMEERH